MRRIALLAFSIALFASAQQSQPPTPRPGVVGQTEQHKEDKKNAVPKTDSNAPTRSAQPVSPPEAEKTKSETSKSAPSPVVVNVNVPKSEFNASDWLMVLFTAGLVGVGYLQCRILKAHHEVMTTSAEAAKSSAETLVLQRGVMDTQAGHIGTMLTEIKKSADAAESSAKTAQRALYITQQPLVLIDRFALVGGIYTLAAGTSDMDKLTQSMIEVCFKNVGSTVARDFYYSIWVCSTDPPFKQLIVSSSRTVLQPNVIVKESTPILIKLFGNALPIAGLFFMHYKVRGFIRYKGPFDELPGVYVEFSGVYDKDTRDFRIQTEIKEDGGYPEPC